MACVTKPLGGTTGLSDLFVFGLCPGTSSIAALEVLAVRGYRLRAIAGRTELLRAAASGAGLILNASGPDGNEAALQAAVQVRQVDPRCPLLLITDRSSEALAIAAMRAAVNDLILHSISTSEAEARIGAIFGRDSGGAQSGDPKS